jgi:Uma2 family endonuclease
MASLSTVRRHLWTRTEYERLVDAGGFDEDARIELLDGEIWEMSPIGTPHATCSLLVEQALHGITGSEFHVRGERPFALDDVSEPQPDVIVVPGAIRDYSQAHPGACVLLVEVSDTSLSHDRGRKLAAYARNLVPEYWIVDVQASSLEVYRDPADATYQSKSVLGRDDKLTPLFAPNGTIAVADLLP